MSIRNDADGSSTTRRFDGGGVDFVHRRWTQARDAQHGEFNCQCVALLTCRIVARCAVHGFDCRVRKDRGIKPYSFFRIAVVPQANRVLSRGCRSGHVISP
jgi:hypothetical protein